MPAILERLVRKMRSKGHSEQSAYAMATAALQRSGKMMKKKRRKKVRG